ncbi:glutamate-cysteine ligase family protein [Morganella morganii]|uniref:glutamate-cysteine ligase family protein n=1 Tax=Morganella morganii TaxID=582 RepID=UPI00078902AA|nr:glutamate-cysteine ligase family protein [Morganella morganii]EKV4236935.1 hypothetical protein [Morganella morganii]ELL8929087.1 hypothetical protein [Morganella morganii]ELY4881106.1 hypothetical protein [Morganella morganii]MBS9570296.1 hypothetical protein [Morganella morganii subsp. morganii]MBT0498100.1 hypothetical protein [Morganella morganii subsp. morganii]
MQKEYRVGIEFEYWLTQYRNKSAAGIKSFDNITLSELAPALNNRPGMDDASLHKGDAGIKAGYWYVEGDERFSPEGKLIAQVIKGIEIRTPPAKSVTAALDSLQIIEAQLSERLKACGLGLAISAYHPVSPRYQFNPPLNAWEKAFREEHAAFRHADLVMQTCGPDINISVPEMSDARVVHAVEKLTFFAPYLVALSLNGPLENGQLWGGLSRRTALRSCHRPTCKGFLTNSAVYPHDFIYPARNEGEHGRIEFKAFDAVPDPALMGAFCAWILGLVLDDTISFNYSVQPDARFNAIAREPFADLTVSTVVETLLIAARRALEQHGLLNEAARLQLLSERLANRMTPADEMITRFLVSGELMHFGGLWPEQDA